jgi:POT family proton-dependent oligopeptide transporter
MAEKTYLTAPIRTDKMPPGIPFIVGNEAAERFTFYGLRSMLVIYMTQHLLNSSGAKAPMSGEDATKAMHLFLFCVYFFPFVGAIVSDAFWGKYRTILTLSLVYCLGPIALAMNQSRVGLFAGLLLVSIGSGGIKPCVSAHVGDQFGSLNQHLLARAFSWFYFAINFGSTFSTALTPWLLQNKGAQIAFGIPAILMALAIGIFWSGRYRFAHVPPAGKTFIKDTFSWKGLLSIRKVLGIFAFIPMFWSLYDQTTSTWVLQGNRMAPISIMGHEVLAAQMQTLNPLFVLLLIPTFTYIFYPAINKVFALTPLRKIGIGFFVVTSSFLIPAWIEWQLAAGRQPSLAWQVPAYFLVTSSEILISITALEFAYTQAPRHMKSLVMSIYLLTIALGNLLTVFVNEALENETVKKMLAGPNYFLFFSGLTFITGIIFIFVARTYKDQIILQEQAPAHT